MLTPTRCDSAHRMGLRRQRTPERSPNQYGDAIVVELPNAGLNAHVATIAWMTAGPSDDRLTREPDIRVAHETRVCFADDDPVLNTAIAALA